MGPESHAVGPITCRRTVRRVRAYLTSNFRYGALYALLWTCGCNLGLRAGDVRRLTYGQLCSDGAFTFTEEKNGNERTMYINQRIRDVLDAYMAAENMFYIHEDALLFWGQKGTPIDVKHIHRIVKDACEAVGLPGNYGSHTMRKTFGYHAYRRSRTCQNLELVQEAFGHSRLSYTQIYTGIDDSMTEAADEGNPRRTLEDLYMGLNL